MFNISFQQFKDVIKMLRKIYNSSTDQQDLLFVNLEVEKLSCGLFDFDWNLLMKVLCFSKF